MKTVRCMEKAHMHSSPRDQLENLPGTCIKKGSFLAFVRLDEQIEVLIAEIPEELQQKAKRRVCLAMDKYDIEKDIATDVKKHFDEECEGSWHCVVRHTLL